MTLTKDTRATNEKQKEQPTHTAHSSYLMRGAFLAASPSPDGRLRFCPELLLVLDGWPLAVDSEANEDDDDNNVDAEANAEAGGPPKKCEGGLSRGDWAPQKSVVGVANVDPGPPPTPPPRPPPTVALVLPDGLPPLA